MTSFRIVRTRSPLLFFGLLLALLAGCRAAPPLPTPPPTESGLESAGPVSLTLWHSETGAAQQALEALATDFHQAYPDLTVTPVYIGNEGDLAKKLMAAIALNQAPDLVIAPRRTIPQFVRQDGLVPLDDLVSDPSLGLSADDQADFFSGILDEGKFPEFDNQLYAFPFDLKGMALFYNADLLQSASLRPPTNWSEFSDTAGKLTKDDRFGWAMNIDSDIFSGMLVSQGSAPIDIPEQHALFEERAGLAAMTLSAQLSASGAAEPEDTRAAAIRDFALGGAGFYMDWMSALPELQAARNKANQNFTIGISNLPQGDPSDPHVLFTGSDLALPRTTLERERRAWFLVRWLTASTQTGRWARAAQSIPLRASAIPSLAQDPSNASLLLEFEKSFGNAAPDFVPLSAHPRIPLVERLMETAWNQCLQPKADIAGILKVTNASANTILAGNQ